MAIVSVCVANIPSELKPQVGTDTFSFLHLLHGLVFDQDRP